MEHNRSGKMPKTLDIIKLDTKVLIPWRNNLRRKFQSSQWEWSIQDVVLWLELALKLKNQQGQKFLLHHSKL